MKGWIGTNLGAGGGANKDLNATIRVAFATAVVDGQDVEMLEPGGEAEGGYRVSGRLALAGGAAS